MAIDFIKCISIIFVMLILSSCVSSSADKLDVKFTDRTTLVFTGKGAAAGMMMDAYLGGAGVAIGIAIDEGIAKNIAENLARSYSDFNIISMVRKELQRKLNSSIQPTTVEIVNYGFRTVAGEGDLAAAWLTIKFTNRDGDVTINYPQDFSFAKTAELSLIKSDAKVAYGMLDQAVADVLTRWVSKSKLKKKEM